MSKYNMPFVIEGLNGEIDHVSRGREILGAAATSKAPAAAAKSKQRVTWTQSKPGKPLTMTPIKPKIGDHKKSIANARDVAKRALSIGKKLEAGLKKSKPKTMVKGWAEITGVAPKKAAAHTAGGKKLRKRLSRTQISKIASLVTKGGKDLGSQADKHQQHLDSSVKALKQGVVKGRNLVTGQQSTSVTGLADEAVNRKVCEILGDEAIYRSIIGDTPGGASADDAEPQADASGNPPDPSSQAAMQPGGVLSDTTERTGDVDPSDILKDPNAGQGAMPTLATLPAPPFTADPGETTDRNAYTSLPEGAIVFDWSKIGADPAIGSRNVFHGNGFGFRFNGAKKKWYGNWGEWDGTLDDWGERWMGEREWPPNNIKRLGSNASFADVQKDSIQAGYGTLVGNPASQDTNGLRYDSGGDQWFWFYDKAPAWAKAPGDALRLQQAITDWKAAISAAQSDAAAQAAHDQLDAEQADALQKSQAQEDAAMAAQQDAESKQASDNAASQSAADQAAAQQQAAAADAQQQAAAAQADTARQASVAQADAARQASTAQADSDRSAWELQQRSDLQQQQDAPSPDMDGADGEAFNGLVGLKRRLGIS